MNEPNPYAPPKARVADVQPAAGDLASRWARLGASLIDGLITLIWALPISYAAGVFDGFPRMTPLPPSRTIPLSALNFVLFLLVQGYFLKRNGQTIGKKVLGMRIATLDGGVPSLGRIIGMRYLPQWVVAVIPGIGSILSLVDVLFIFRVNRRCVHDLIAGTKVVQA